MNLHRIDRLALISAGCLLFVGFAGCTASRTQSATADNRPQDTIYGGTPYRRPGPQYNGPQFNSGPALDPGYAAEEYPDFRGNRKRFATGDGHPPAAQSDRELLEPARLPDEDEGTGTDSTDRRSFRETLHQKVSGFWHRRPSSGPSNEVAAQPPTAGEDAAAGWNVRIDDNRGARAAAANSRKPETANADAGIPDTGIAGAGISDTGMFNLDAPLERPRRTASVNTGLANSPSTVQRFYTNGQAVASRPARGSAENLPEWSDRRPNDPTATMVSKTRKLPSGLPQQSGELAASDSALDRQSPEKPTLESEPVRMADPPRLSVPPSGDDPEKDEEAAASLTVSRMVLCRQVRGYDDVAEIQSQQLRRGQPVLIYAALDNFLSIVTAKGYKTLTLSTLEIRRPDGDVVLRMPLGTAVDLSETPRQDFFLTHRITIPENLPAGEYILSLRIDDLQAHESSRSQLAVTVTGDRTRPDGAGDTSKFAIRPEGYQR